jgi:hypothetical protein
MLPARSWHRRERGAGNKGALPKEDVLEQGGIGNQHAGERETAAVRRDGEPHTVSVCWSAGFVYPSVCLCVSMPIYVAYVCTKMYMYN